MLLSIFHESKVPTGIDFRKDNAFFSTNVKKMMSLFHEPGQNRLFEHGEELVFVDDGHTQFLCLFQLRGTHVLACEDEGGLAADAAHVLASVLFDDGLVLVAAVVGEDSADDDALALEFSGEWGIER